MILDIMVAMVVSKGLVINYGEGGATKWENLCPKLFAHPLKTGSNFLRPPPLLKRYILLGY